MLAFKAFPRPAPANPFHLASPIPSRHTKIAEVCLARPASLILYLCAVCFPDGGALVPPLFSLTNSDIFSTARVPLALVKACPHASRGSASEGSRCPGILALCCHDLIRPPFPSRPALCPGMAQAALFWGMRMGEFDC